MVLLAGLVLAVTGCGGSNTEPQTLPDLEEEREAREVLERLKAKASPLEKRILADGVVTPAEHDQAAAAVVDCAAEHGIEAHVNYDDDGKITGFTAESSNDLNQATAPDDPFDVCWRTHYDAVSTAVADQEAMSPSDRRQLDSLMVACLAGHDIVVDEWPGTAADIDPSVEADCYDRSVQRVGGG